MVEESELSILVGALIVLLECNNLNQCSSQQGGRLKAVANWRLSHGRF